MKNYQFFGVIKYTAAGIALGVILIIIGTVLNYYNGFNGPWFNIFEFSPDFVVVVFSPIYLSLLFCFIGIRREQLVNFNHEIKDSLTQEQIINSTADHQLKLLANVIAQVNEGIIISDVNGMVQWVNEGFTKITGFTLEEVKGKEQVNILKGPQTDQTIVKSLIEKLITGEAVVEELISYHKN